MKLMPSILLLSASVFAQTWTDLGVKTVFDHTVNANSPCPANGYLGYAYTGSCYSVIDAWGAGAVDEQRNLLYLVGGGHVDTYDDSLYAIDPTGANVACGGVACAVRLWGPATDTVFSCGSQTQNTPSGQPNATHGYGTLIYLPKSDKLWRLGGSDCGGTPYYYTVFTMPAGNPSAGWTLNSTNSSLGVASSGTWCVLDPTQEDDVVYCAQAATQIWKWDQQTQAWTLACNYNTCSTVSKDYNGNSVMGSALSGTPVFETSRRRIWLFNGYPTNKIHVYDVAANTIADATPQTTNCTTSEFMTSGAYQYPGAGWDQTTETIRIYGGVGNVVTEFNPATLTCRDITPAGSGPPTDAGIGGANGPVGKFGYLPKLNAWVMLTGGSTHAFIVSFRNSTGLGGSKITSSGPCLDLDGDGYGVGAGCLGPDADDHDATVHTAAQAIAKWGSINAFLIHIGYQTASSPATVYCVQAGGSGSTASTNADTACTTPYPSWTSLPSLSSPYIVIFRGVAAGGGQATYTQQIALPPSGTAARQNYVIGYPGEQPIEDYSASSGQTFNLGGISYVTVDGFRVKANASGPGIGSGAYFPWITGSHSQAVCGPGSGVNSGNCDYTQTTINMVLTHLEVSGAGTDSNFDIFNQVSTQVVENVVHDPDPVAGQHNIYLGANSAPSWGVQISRNILYNVQTGGYPNLAWNGRCFGCYIEQNLVYNSDQQAISVDMGFNHSIIRNNLAFNTGGYGGGASRSFTLMNYASGQCGDQGQITSGSGPQSICAWNQNYNIIENNTLWAGTQQWPGGGTAIGSAFFVANDARPSTACGTGLTAPCGDMGHNTYRNNIIIAAGTGAYPAVVYGNANTTETDPGYLATDLWVDNLVQLQTTSTGNLLGVWNGNAYAYYGCSGWNLAAASGSTGCSTSNPAFVSAVSANYASPQLYNYRLTTGSPALNAGDLVAVSPFDLVGTVTPSIPSIGAYQSTGNLQATAGAAALSGLTCSGCRF